MNVTLRPLKPSDAGWLDGWLPSLAASVGYDAPPGAGKCVICRDGQRAGIVAWRLRPREHAAVLELVAVPPDGARHGSGMSGAVALEVSLKARGVRRIYAPAPEVHGIALYFWIRLGYRPLPRADWPCERAGVAWMVREI